jgi:hypothetical protein
MTIPGLAGHQRQRQVSGQCTLIGQYNLTADFQVNGDVLGGTVVTVLGRRFTPLLEGGRSGILGPRKDHGFGTCSRACHRPRAKDRTGWGPERRPETAGARRLLGAAEHECRCPIQPLQPRRAYPP